VAKTRELVSRRKAIRNIRKITRTMELIATARFKKALDRATEAEAFTRKIAEVAADLARSGSSGQHPLLATRTPVKKALLLVICSNRGLCGGYNAGILREAYTRIRKAKESNIALDIEASGKRSINSFKYQKVVTTASYTQFDDKPKWEDLEPVARKYLAAFLAGEIDQLDVAYMKFISPARQTPIVETLLPLAGLPQESTKQDPAKKNKDAQTESPVDYEFAPNAAEILDELLPQSFRTRLFKCFLDAAVSEQIGRRVTMKAATENADSMIKTISRQYNRARQASITKEISEVIGGAAALE